jgi:hypothetical protein
MPAAGKIIMKRQLTNGEGVAASCPQFTASLQKPIHDNTPWSDCAGLLARSNQLEGNKPILLHYKIVVDCFA